MSVNEQEFLKLKNTAINVEKVKKDNITLKNKMNAFLSELEGKKEQLNEKEYELLEKKVNLDKIIENEVNKRISSKLIDEKIRENKLISENKKLKKVVEAIKKILPESTIKEIVQMVEAKEQTRGMSL